jgi:hypothetical protein
MEDKQDISSEAQGQLRQGVVRFQLPSAQQLIEVAILFNEGVMDREAIGRMVAMSQWILDRLHENGDIEKPSSKEGN